MYSGLRLEMRLEMRERISLQDSWVLGSSLSLLREGKATLWDQ